MFEIEDLFGKCGNNCGHCAGFVYNLRTSDARQRCSDGWFKYLGFRQSPAVCHCEGCQIPDKEDEKPSCAMRNSPGSYGMRRSAGNCAVRKCAFMNGAKNCAYCSKYPCEDLRTLFRSEPAREQIAMRVGSPVLEEDYLAFIEPYEAKKHLDRIHSSLSSNQLIEPVKPSVARMRLAPFPHELTCSKGEVLPFKRLYDTLTAIKFEKPDTYARQDTLEKRKEFLFRLLWAFGRFGKSKEKDESSLLLDAGTYRAQKISSLLARMTDYFESLESHGIHCKVVPLVKERDKWLMSNGWLRGKSWLVELSFDESIGGASMARALRKYNGALEEKHRRRAYATFSSVDMTVLAD